MFKRLTVLGCVLLMIATATFTARAQGALQSAPQVTVASPILTLHTLPNQYAPAVTVLQNGDALTPDGRTNDARWLHVSTKDNQLGWVLLSFLTLSNDLIVQNLPVLDNNAPSGGGTNNSGSGAAAPAVQPTIAPTKPSVANNAPPVVGGHVGGSFELGGQVQGLSGNTVNAMRTAGMRWVKQQAQSGDGGANGLIDQAHSLGFKILLSVVGDHNSVTDNGYQNGYASYVAGLAAHGADAIEVWNEMNLDREWPAGQISPTIYVSLLSKAYNAIKSANPGTMVISGAPSPTGAEGAFGLAHVWNDNHYYAGMAAAGAGHYVDCIGAHYNEGIVSPDWTSGDPRDDYPTRYFPTMTARASRPFGLPICYTELGYLTPEGYGGLPGNFAWAQNTTVAQQAAWLARAAVRASQSGRVRLMIIFNVDFTYFGADPQAGYAMIRPGGGCPACSALGSVMH